MTRNFLVFALLATPSLGDAATRRPPPPQPDPAACIKLCPQDRSPCDPVYFKTADNRCSARYR